MQSEGSISADQRELAFFHDQRVAPVIRRRSLVLAIAAIASGQCAASAAFSQETMRSEEMERRSSLFVEVGIISMGGTPWDMEGNFLRLEKHVRAAAARRAQLVVAPEAILDGYVCAADAGVTRERMLTVAQRVPDGPYLGRAAALSRELNIYLVFGFLENAAG